MRSTIMMIAGLVLLIASAAPVPARAESWDPERAAGRFFGQAFSGGDLVPVATTFWIDEAGRLRGSYSFVQQGSQLNGTLDHARTGADRRVMFIWTDPFGHGTLDVTFAADFDSFTALWAPLDDGADAYPWVGSRAP